MPSFDIVSEVNQVELHNAVDQANKEITTRFDFKGSSAKVELAEKSAKERELMLFGDSDFQLEQVRDVLLGRLAKRGVDIRFLDLSAKSVKLGGDKLKLPVLKDDTERVLRKSFPKSPYLTGEVKLPKKRWWHLW